MKKINVLLGAAALLVFGSCSQKATEKTTDAVEETVATTVVEAPVIPAQADGTVHELTDASLYTADARPEGLLVVDFNAVWCGPCRQLKPVFEEMAKKFEGKATFVSVDVDKYGQLMQTYNLGEYIPVVMIMKPDGSRVHFTGTDDLIPAEKFEKVIEAALAE